MNVKKYKIDNCTKIDLNDALAALVPVQRRGATSSTFEHGVQTCSVDFVVDSAFVHFRHFDFSAERFLADARDSDVYYVAACCSMLQGVAACCRVLQHVAGCCSMLQGVAGCCSVLQGVAAWRCAELYAVVFLCTQL